MRKKKVNLCIVKANNKIRTLLALRFNKANNSLSLADICKDAEDKGMTIDKSGLSKYLKKKFPVSGGLTQEQILWLTVRYGIDVKLTVDVKDYTEEQCLENITKIWGPLPKKI